MKIRALRGFAFDLDGTIWAGKTLLPGATELVQALRDTDRRVVFLTNSSRLLSSELSSRLAELGIPAEPTDVLAAIDLLGETIRRRLGAIRVLPLGTPELAQVLEASGHTVVDVQDWPQAQAVAVGNDPAFDFARLRAASRAVAAGATFFTINLDPRLPVGPGEFDPGCGAMAEAVAVASGTRPIVIGKPHRPIFEMALERLGCHPSEAAMVGDSQATDIAGGRAAGMFTIWLDPAGGHHEASQVDLAVHSLVELHELWHGTRG
jgi:HAD superfamily hydrolase (TIGR01450 family)